MSLTPCIPESFLHFIWQQQYFNKTDLKTTKGEVVDIVKPGFLNRNAGPDFLGAQVKVGEIVWHGNVEIHVNSSDWDHHQHKKDPAYNNVVLHVIWHQQNEVQRNDGTQIPAFELKDRIDPQLITRYRDLVNNPSAIPCQLQFSGVKDIVKTSAIEAAAMQRLERKAREIIGLFKPSINDWEEVSYQCFLRSFGFKVNADAFYELSKRLPLKIIRKHSDMLFRVEALLFGQAGMLEANYHDDHYLKLQREYDFLSKKYGLEDRSMLHLQWRFSRLRPANFPTLRLAQIAALLHKTTHLFSAFRDLGLDDLRCLLASTPSEYWQKHYHFGKSSVNLTKTIGKQSVDNIIMNTVAPVLAAYALVCDQQENLDKASALLEALPAEKNRITRSWQALGFRAENALQSQGSIELYNGYCAEKKCLSCKIGMTLLKR